MDDVCRVITQTRLLFEQEPDRWTRNQEVRERSFTQQPPQYCLMGGLKRVAMENKVPYTDVEKRVYKYLPNSFQSLARFNDSSSSVSEVIKVLKLAEKGCD